LLDGTDRYSLKEVGIQESYQWPNPNDNQGKPDEFCITRIESGYWEIKFNRLPDSTYTVYFEIAKHWVDVDETSSGDTTEIIITKDFYDAFSLYCSIERYRQQGDTENYQLASDEWFNPAKPQNSLLTRILGKLNKPLKQKSVQVDMENCGVIVNETTDYSKDKA
jgi:hypothetical protein